MKNADWLSELKVGDRVIVENGRSSYVGQVSRCTSLRIVLTSGQRFGRITGLESVRGLYGSASLRPFAEKMEASDAHL